MDKDYFVLISGGPGLFDPKDKKAHDRSWANYVTPPLLLAKRGSFQRSNEMVVWYVYKPAYEKRWDDDAKNPHKKEYIEKAVQKVKGEGLTSYVGLIEARAKGNGWDLQWLGSASELWTKLASLKRPIARVYYWGHARDDLWLSLNHSADGVARTPEAAAQITTGSVFNHKHLNDRFSHAGIVTGGVAMPHRFIGCNTKAFAESWFNAFGVYTEGVIGTIDFGSIYETNGEPKLEGGATRKVFEPAQQ